jgi:[ribosomal protein S18]-alanine N-acetyltransferase
MIRLRDAVEADLHSLFELDQVCFPAGIAYSRSEFRFLLTSSRTIRIVAEDDAFLAGFAIVQTGRLRGRRIDHLVTIDVAPAFRRHGIGRMLMDEILTRLITAGADLLRLEVAVNNAEALAFYSNLGFDPIGRIPGYYHGNLDALVLEKSLKPGPDPNSGSLNP